MGVTDTDTIMTQKRHKPKKGMGGGSIGPLPSTFDTIHPIG